MIYSTCLIIVGFFIVILVVVETVNMGRSGNSGYGTGMEVNQKMIRVNKVSDSGMEMMTMVQKQHIE